MYNHFVALMQNAIDKSISLIKVCTDPSRTFKTKTIGVPCYLTLLRKGDLRSVSSRERPRLTILEYCNNSIRILFQISSGIYRLYQNQAMSRTSLKN